MKEIEIPMVYKHVEVLNREVDKVKKASKIRKAATRKNLTNLYEILKEEILVEEVPTAKASEEPIPVS